MIRFGMAAISRLLQALGAFLVIAAVFAPAAARAHSGHPHSATVSVATVSGPAASYHQTAAAELRTEVMNAVPASTRPPTELCSGHCCSGIAGATCCSVALAPDVVMPPDRSGSSRLLIACTQALLGLAPEALPKPPRLIG